VLAWAVFHLSVAATVGKGHHRPELRRQPVDLRRADRRDLVEPHHLVLRHPFELVARVDRRHDRRALVKAGTAPLLAPGILKTASFIFIAPLLGMAFGATLMLIVSWVCFRQTPRRVDKWFRRLQLISSASYSMGHGGNDAQKTMGIIWLLLIANGVTTKDHLPTWVVMSCFLAIGVGTMFGGWRIVKTMGQRITKLKPVGGFAAECAGSITLFMATHFGIPVSTTHTITGAIIGVGTTRGTSAVRWGVAGSIVIAWIITIPASAGIAALAWWLGGLLF
jgi:PiT family inorganic phosphate transporter